MRVFWLASLAALAGSIGCSSDAGSGGRSPKSDAGGEESGGAQATSGGSSATNGGSPAAAGVTSGGGRAGAQNGAGGRAGAQSGTGGRAGAQSGTGGRAGTPADTGGRSGTGGSAGASASGGSTTGPGTTFGKAYEGGLFHLGPVDYAETQWHNACAPGTKYAPSVQAAEGNLLAGLWNGIPDVANYCDACIAVTTAKGKSAVLRVVTYGDTTMNSIDVSPEAYAILNSGENPRSMSFQFAQCPDTGKMMYEFQTGSNEWWTSFWLRNARIPLTKVEVKSKNHSSYVALERGSDGTLTDASGFGNGPFSIRATGADGRQVVDDFDWPAAGIAGAMLTGKANFD